MTLSLSVYLLCRVWMCAWECASGATGAPAPCLSLCLQRDLFFLYLSRIEN